MSRRESKSAARSSRKAAAKVMAMPADVFKAQLTNEIAQVKNNVKLALALGKTGGSADFTTKHLTYLVSQSARRLKSMAAVFKKSVGGRRDRKNLAAWVDANGAAGITMPKSEQPHLFDARLAELLESQTYTVAQPVEGQRAGKFGSRTAITGVREMTLRAGDYVKAAPGEFKGHVVSTKANMKALLSLYLAKVGRAKGPVSGQAASTPTIDLSNAREFQQLYAYALRVQEEMNRGSEKKAERKTIDDWSNVRYATANSVVSMLGARHKQLVRAAAARLAGVADNDENRGKVNREIKNVAARMPSVPSVVAIAKANKRATAWERSDRGKSSRGGSRGMAGAGASPRNSRGSRPGSR